MTVADLTEEGWVRGVPILGLEECWLLEYADGAVRFRHKCHRVWIDGFDLIVAPKLQIGNGHTVTFHPEKGPTVRASIMCGDCGLHGFITDGRWEPA